MTQPTESVTGKPGAAQTQDAAEELELLRRELRETQAQLYSILRASTGYGIVLMDADYRVLHFNAAADALFQIAADAAINEPLSDERIALILRAPNLDEVRAALGTGGRWEAEVEHDRVKDYEGYPRLVQIVITSTHSRAADTLSRGYLLIARDITDQRRRERSLLESQRMDSIGLLAGGIAHDFNNILMGILGYSSLVKDMLGPAHSAFRMLDTIEKAAERAVSLTNQLLAYSRGGKLQSVYVNLDQMVTDMLNIIGSNISKQINMVHEPADELPWVVVDPVQLQQVIMNLCINSSEAIAEKNSQMPPEEQGGTITLSTGVSQFDLDRRRFRGIGDVQITGEFVYLRVEDDGCGLTPETLARIFEPFFTTKFTGRGLGLSAVEGIVRNHGGAMSVVSRRGQGSVFTIYLPAKRTIVMEGEDSDLPKPLQGTETILFVDDEPVARQLGLLTLANLGYRVLLAENGRIGLDAYKENVEDISIVILDLTMPEMNGEEVLTAMAELHSLSGREFATPILLTSGYDESAMDELSHRSSATSFLQKPYTPEQLSRAVRELLDRVSRLTV